MTEKTIEIQEETFDKERNPMVGLAHKVLLASIGAVALAQGEIEEFVNRLIERGEIAEKDGRTLLNDVMERRKEQVAGAEDQLDRRIEVILGRMNVPTKADIDELSAKITVLTKKVESLKE